MIAAVGFGASLPRIAASPVKRFAYSVVANDAPLTPFVTA
jgi:hypothetical protein